MNWVDCDQDVVEIFASAMNLPLDSAKLAKAGFYHRGYIVHASHGTEECGLVIVDEEGRKRLVILTGKVTDIYEANLHARLILDRELVLDYACFVFDHIGTPGIDVFRIVDEVECVNLSNGKVIRDMRPVVKHIDANGTYWIKAYQEHNNGLYRISLRVAVDGTVAVPRNRPLGQIVSTPSGKIRPDRPERSISRPQALWNQVRRWCRSAGAIKAAPAPSARRAGRH